MKGPRRTLLYAGAVALAAWALAALFSFSSLGGQFDNNAYDFLYRAFPPRAATSPAVLVVFDERTFQRHGGIRRLRANLARLMERIADARPAAVAVDITLADPGDPQEDARLAAAMARVPGLVLACEMMPDGSGWQDPIAPFRRHAAALGHVSTLAGPYDDVNRRITLERVAGRERRWALSLETLRVLSGGGDILASPADLSVGGRVIPSRWDEGRPLRVRYSEGGIPSVSAGDLLDGAPADALAGKAVFIGVTAISAAPDRLFTPLSRGLPMAGVAIHAQAFQTMHSGAFLPDAPAWLGLLLALAGALLIAGPLAAVMRWHGWALAGAAAAALHILPLICFKQDVVLPASAPAATAWLALAAGGAFRYFYVRRRLEASEAATRRYQQAFHFVAHEMRTPLTAIQGSSELISRYNLPEAKRRELSQMINAESKRLARMITTFLDVEKLSAGQMELRLAEIDAAALVDACCRRAAPLAERKRIRLSNLVPPDLRLKADAELLEYAVYNLLTNAVKYSPEETEVRVGAAAENGQIRLWVTDQGIGMDEAEMKNLFRKFYRTKRAEQSGETGTGIGLSIVRQIVELHEGDIRVQSAPGRGSTFTLVLPAR
ncbi:MAG: CHASE2 and HATPase_c domain-containing protein [Bryobacteraceae bacterium]|nr:CHASE2 and HATPase_c domain-containing protein [Bryobacteraceae bacterium]